MKHDSFIWLIIVVLSTLSCGVVYASPTKVSITVIEAKSNTIQVDPKLSVLKSSLRSSFPQFTHFKWVSHSDRIMKKNRDEIIKISNGLDAHFRLLQRTSDLAHLSLKIPAKKAQFTLNARLSRLFYQAMRWKGKTYLLAIRAQ